MVILTTKYQEGFFMMRRQAVRAILRMGALLGLAAVMAVNALAGAGPMPPPPQLPGGSSQLLIQR
jgi:hypothetical protein